MQKPALNYNLQPPTYSFTATAHIPSRQKVYQITMLQMQYTITLLQGMGCK